MAFEESNMIMPVSPMYGNNGGFGGYGGDWGSWIILFLIFGMFNGGWGGMGGFGGGLGYDFPWLLNGQNNTDNLISNGFQNSQLSNQLNGIQSAVTSGFGDVQTALCGGFAGVNSTVNGAQNAITQQLYTNQIADLERSFASQTAISQNMNALQSQFADCCCENRLANCQTQNIIQNEGNATRFADANNTRDLLTNQTANTQAILDKLCQLELDGYKRENDSLRTQLTAANFRESQTAQNALISQGFANEVDQLYNRLSNCPVPTTPVYGRTPIFTCNQNNGCGCGM